MYEYLRGDISDKKATSLVLDVGGIGFYLDIPISTADRLPSEGRVQIWVHHHVREDNERLFGFATREERDLFRLLQKVSGVGPALAIAVLSRADVTEVADAIGEGRVDYLKSLKGVGPKTAQRIVTELADKVAPFAGRSLADVAARPQAGALESDAIQALEILGCPPKSARQAVRKVLGSEKDAPRLEELVRRSLKVVWPT